jgi:uncharacterized lipoprotein YddW (UPF0748 family)
MMRINATRLHKIPPSPQPSPSRGEGARDGALVLALICVFTNFACAQLDAPPPAPREFRGAWVASVNNGNWPSKPGLTVEQQKAEMLRILDTATNLHLNAIILQVRPAADALYPSDLEPWSQYLTGVQGQPPSPLYDPLQTWIDECHRRGLELHAWFNPYRVRDAGSKAALAPTSIARRDPEIVREYGGYLWMDPGEPRAAKQTLDVILDIVRRYDVDGIHTDDYYYPYKVSDPKTKKTIDFPDAETYARYRRGGGKLQLKDWRRQNVNLLIERIYRECKKAKPWVKVGYAPFGIWQPNYPPGIKGLNQYDTLYADAKLWLNKGWLDYMSPQLYWPIKGDQSFPALLKWWLSENTQKRHIWPGMSVGRHSVDEVVNQITITRETGANGAMYWSINSLLKRGELQTALAQKLYREPALIPAMPWIDRTAPPPPTVSAQRSDAAVTVSFKPGRGEPTSLYAVYARYGEQWRFTVVPGGTPSLTLNADATSGAPTAIVVSSIDRCGNESPRVTPRIR